MRMMKAKRSSMKVLTKRYPRNFQGRWLTDLRWWLMKSCGVMRMKPKVYTVPVSEARNHEYHDAC